MQLSGGDADLGPHAEFGAIGKLGRGVAHQDRTVESRKEPLGGCVIFGQDRFGMARAMRADMADRLIHPIDQLDGDDPVQKLAPEIVRRCGHRARYLAQNTIGPHLDPCLQQILDQDRPVPGIELPVDQQTFGRTTDAGAPGLGVQDDAAGLVQIGVAIGIDMADAFKMRKDRHPRLGLNQRHQTLAAARHDHVDMGHGAHHGAHRRPVAGRHQLDRGLGQAGGLQPRHHAGMDRRRRMVAFAAAAQDHRIAGLQAQRTGIGGDVRAAFIDDANHAQGRAHPADVQPRRHIPIGHDRAHRVFLFANSAQAIDDRPDPAFVQRQPVDHRAAQGLLLGIGQILAIGVKDRLPPLPDRIGGTDKCRMFPLGRGNGQLCRRGAGLGPHIRNQRCYLIVRHPTPHFALVRGDPARHPSITISSRWISAARPA